MRPASGLMFPVRNERPRQTALCLSRSACLLGLFASAACRTAAPSTGVGIVAAPAFALNPVYSEENAWLAAARLSAEPSVRVQLTGLNNETLSIRLAVTPVGDPLRELQLRTTPLVSPRGRIEPSAMRAYRMHAVTCPSLPGWHIRSIPPPDRRPDAYDVLVPIEAPRGGLPDHLPAETSLPLWVDLLIPKGTPQGRYIGEIELLSAGRVAAAVQLELDVLPVMLPEEAEHHLIGEVDHEALIRHHLGFEAGVGPVAVDDWRGHPQRDQIEGLIRSTMRMLSAHRMTPVLDNLAPVAKADGHGRLRLAWGAYDAVVEPILDGRAFSHRVPVRVWPLPASRLLSADRRTGITPQVGGWFDAYLSGIVEHFAEKGWLDRAYLDIPRAVFREVQPGGSALMASAAREPHRAGGRDGGGSDLLSRIAAADLRVAVLYRWFPQDMRPYGWVDYLRPPALHAVDVWMPKAQFYEPAAMRSERRAGRRTFLAVDRPPYSGTTALSAPPADVRVLAWQGLQLGAEALHVGCVNNWPESNRHADPSECVQADPRVLLYPGRAFGVDEPVPSVRLKLLRQTMQDAAYLRLLKEHGLEHIRTTLLDSVAPAAGTEAYRSHFADGRPIGWARDPEAYESATAIMARELVQAIYGPQDQARVETLQRTATWRRLMSQTRTVQLLVDGCRVRLTGVPPQWSAKIDCAVTIVNRKRVPVNGALTFETGPAEPMKVGGSADVTDLRPNESRQVRLLAAADVLITGSDGCTDLPVVFETEEGETFDARARLCCIAPVPMDHPIRLDGDLSDWPPGSTNVADNFQWITGSHPSDVGDDAHRPARTIAFALIDGHALYLGVSCRTERDAAQLASRSNTIEYDDLVPVGEELIEVLIDPINAGTRSPSDVYHIAVKPSGAAWWEKGLAFDPPCGRRQPWPADIQTAVKTAANQWTVEMRIPLRAFVAPMDQPAIWGFNVTRYDGARDEFSTWSGAVGNAYDPLSLGNVYVPAAVEPR